MKKLYALICLMLVMVILTGCAKKFHLERFPKHPESEWRFARKDLSATAQVSESAFQGKLNLKWEESVDESPVGPITLGADRVIVPTTRERAHFFDRETGKYQGRVKMKGNAQTGVVVVDSLAYYAEGHDENYLKCLNLHTLRRSWRVPLKDATGPPIILNNQVFLASTTGFAECRDRLTGDSIWRTKMSSRSPAGPSIDGETVYFPLDDGNLTAMDINKGEIIYEVNLEEPLMSKVAIDHYVFVSGSEGSFFAVDKESGDVIWKRLFDWPIWTAPAVDENMVYIGDNGGYLHALDKSDGRTIWNFKSDGVVLASPIVVGDYLLFASLDKFLYCLDKKSGLLNSKWKTKHEIRFSPISDGESIYIATHGGDIQCLGD